MIFEFDSSRWPLIVVRLGSGNDAGEQDKMFAAWEGAFARREKFVAITDARAVKSVGSARDRQRVAAWTKSVEVPVKRYSLGHATVITSALVRGAMTAVTWLHKPPAPQEYFGTMIDACDWCVERLRGGGIEVPTSVLEFRAATARAER